MVKFTNKMQEQVKEFHETAGHPVAEKPTVISLERAIGRSTWGVIEEVMEFIHASCSNDAEYRQALIDVITGVKVAYNKNKDKPFPQTEEERIIAQVDANIDTLYFTKGNLVENGVDAQPLFDIVHDANMSKFFYDDNGKPYAKYDDGGKVIKSPNFWSPEEKIADEIKRQINPKKSRQSKKVDKLEVVDDMSELKTHSKEDIEKLNNAISEVANSKSEE